MTEVQIKEKINNYLDKLSISKLEEIATYIETIYQTEKSQLINYQTYVKKSQNTII